MSATSARYRVTAFAISLAALAYMQRVAISQAAPFIQSDLGLDKRQLGLVFGAFGLAYALFEIPNGLFLFFGQIFPSKGVTRCNLNSQNKYIVFVLLKIEL